MRNLILVVMACACALLSSPAMAETFDFDTGTPALSTGQNAPFDQTSGAITASFGAPAGAGKYSIQTAGSTGFTLTQFSGHYLYPNGAMDLLDIKFNKALSSISFTFATADFPPIENPTPIKLTAYLDSTGNPPVGSAAAQGAYTPIDTLPMGTLSFSSAAPFNLVEIGIQAGGGSGFLMDNVSVTAVPEPGSLALLGIGLVSLVPLARRRRRDFAKASSPYPVVSP